MNWFFSKHAKVKSKYRQSILNIRNALSSSEVSSLSKEIVKNVNAEFRLDEVGILGSYFSVNNEVDLTAINKKRLNEYIALIELLHKLMELINLNKFEQI